MQTGSPTGDLKQQITDLGLQYRLMTQFTSFVAVEEMTITEGGQPKTVQVPVEMPDGVSREGVFGAKDGEGQYTSATLSGQYSPRSKMYAQLPAATPSTGYVNGGIGAGNISLGHRDEKTSVDEASRQPAPAKQEGKKLEPKFKISPSLQQVMNCVRVQAVSSQAAPKNGQGAGCATDKDGKVSVQLQLTDKSAETMKQLQALGFEIASDPRSSATVAIGRISALKLEDLAKLDVVRYVSNLDTSQGGAPAVSKGGKR
jgi:Ca-activated chloride channel family protein